MAEPTPPAVRDEAWPHNELDRFVLARLEAEGLAPAPEADRRTLLRRASQDLLGLPPSAAERQPAPFAPGGARVNGTARLRRATH